MIALLVITANGRPEGAPPEACAQIAPMHAGISPSTDPLPFSVDLSDFTGGEYVPGDTYLSKTSFSVVYACNNLICFLYSYNFWRYK